MGSKYKKNVIVKNIFSSAETIQRCKGNMPSTEGKECCRNHILLGQWGVTEVTTHSDI